MFNGKKVSAAKWGRQGLVLAANDCTRAQILIRLVDDWIILRGVYLVRYLMSHWHVLSLVGKQKWEHSVSYIWQIFATFDRFFQHLTDFLVIWLSCDLMWVGSSSVFLMHIGWTPFSLPGSIIYRCNIRNTGNIRNMGNVCNTRNMRNIRNIWREYTRQCSWCISTPPSPG